MEIFGNLLLDACSGCVLWMRGGREDVYVRDACESRDLSFFLHELLKGICFRGSAMEKGAWVMGRWGG